MKLPLVLSLVFLSSAAGLAAQPRSTSSTASRSPEPPERVTCRTFVRTGSLAGTYRSCKTNREWQREHENVQQLQVSASSRTAQ